MADRPQKVGLYKPIHGNCAIYFYPGETGLECFKHPISLRSDVNVRGLEEACTFLLSTSDQIQKRTPLEAGNIAHLFARTKRWEKKRKNLENLEVFLGGGLERRIIFP